MLSVERSHQPPEASGASHDRHHPSLTAFGIVLAVVVGAV